LPSRRTSGGSKEFYTEWEESFDSFDQMGLKENLLRGIYAYGGSPSLPACVYMTWKLKTAAAVAVANLTYVYESAHAQHLWQPAHRQTLSR
jgi:hypothetical protein